MYEQVFKSIDNDLRSDAGCSSELDYIEQTSWILFLKYLGDQDDELRKRALLDGTNYAPILEPEYSWKTWAAPTNEKGEPDYKNMLGGDDLLNWVNNKLFPYLAAFKNSGKKGHSIHYHIGEIFSELRNRLHSGHTLRDVVDKANQLKFLSNETKHELSSLYEDKIKSMGNAGRNGGEYYTPRPLIRAIVETIKPRIGEKVYDGAVGSAGFLCEAYDYMEDNAKGATDYEVLQQRTFYGREKKLLPFVVGIMNMILHGVKAPDIEHTNTLEIDLADIPQSKRVDVVLANPPFGGNEHKRVQKNFPVATSETAYLFLQHFIKMLKAGGRAGIVIKNTLLSNTDNASIELRKQLLEECNLHTILDMPSGTFTGAGVKTVVLFFDKGTPTQKVWYYQLDPGRRLGKTDPLNARDMADFLMLQPDKSESDNSWSVDVADIDKETWDLTVKNPNREEEIDNRTPLQIIDAVEGLSKQTAHSLRKIRELL